MANLFVQSIKIDNFRCFNGEEIHLNTPDGRTPGSGLNVLIGENGCGKTTVLDALNLIVQTGFSAQNKIDLSDFNKYETPIEITAVCSKFKCKMPYAGNYFKANGFKFIANPRNRKAPNRVLSSPITTKSELLNTTVNYFNSKNEDTGKAIQALYKQYSSDKIIEDDLNIFYFDKNRSRHSTSGTFKTLFDRICDDLNWKFLKNLRTENQTSIAQHIATEGAFHTKSAEIAQKGVGKKLSTELAEFFNEEQYKDLKIDLMKLLQPFSGAFFAVRKEGELSQVSIRNLGSGVEIILTLLLLKSIYSQEGSRGSILFLIDEPELHLHPKAQDKLAELLLTESKTKQIVIASHSPYLLKPLMKASRLIVLKQDDSSIRITDQTTSKNLFPWSPSWGEITHKAFDMPTVEFHNELYGYLQEQSGHTGINNFETHLVGRGLIQSKNWIEIRNGNQRQPRQITLQTYIRHSIHHPENQANTAYTVDELNKSILEMIALV